RELGQEDSIAKGTRFSARTTWRFVRGLASHAPKSLGSDWTASRMRIRTTESRSANRTPAIPAARGVRSPRATAAPDSIALLSVKGDRGRGRMNHHVRETGPNG